MSEETLFTAARRALRNFDIDMNKGGIITTDTLIAMDTMRKEIDKEAERQNKQRQQQEKSE